MAEANGPALLVHNDSVFSNDDFDNLTKLGSGAKKNILETVGNFGLGFNSVYNLTDVPSIISRNSIVFLDPNVKFLKNRIKNNSKPGIRLDLSKRSREELMSYSDQFKPYENVFNCQPFSDNFFYNGTLFRLPLRSEASEISSTVYNDAKVKELFDILYTHGNNNILLFTQSIRKIEFHVIENSDSPASIDMKLVFEFEKSGVQYLAKHSQILNLRALENETELNREFRTQCSVLKAAASMTRGKGFETSMIVRNRVRTNIVTFERLFGKKEQLRDDLKDDFWLIVNSFSSSYMKKGDDNFKKFIPCVGLAAEIE
jgi:sacsin